MRINFYKILCVLMVFSPSLIISQNYFPLEIGNRWDYTLSQYYHGGTAYNSNYSVEIIDKEKINDKEYFICSNNYIFDSKYFCMKNDSLFTYNEKDSSECLIFVFNQLLNSSYYSCLYDTVYYWNKTDLTYFGQPDSQQHYSINYNSIVFEFSKTFGFVNSSEYNILREAQNSLTGCIISGIQYGILLSSEIEDDNNNFSFQLNQNYPNPFNPSTTIKYTIPKKNFIQIIVYDILGNEVQTLVNEEKPAGIYELEFDAAKMSSGVYFYRLTSADYAATKKMMVLK